MCRRTRSCGLWWKGAVPAKTGKCPIIRFDPWAVTYLYGAAFREKDRSPSSGNWQSNQKRKDCKSRWPGQTDGTRCHPFNCSSKIHRRPVPEYRAPPHRFPSSWQQISVGSSLMSLRCQVRAGRIPLGAAQSRNGWKPASQQEARPINRVHGRNSGRSSVIVIQRAAQTFTAVNGACIREVALFRALVRNHRGRRRWGGVSVCSS